MAEAMVWWTGGQKQRQRAGAGRTTALRNPVSKAVQISVRWWGMKELETIVVASRVHPRPRFSALGSGAAVLPFRRVSARVGVPNGDCQVRRVERSGSDFW
jgi:hypothetical protein